ncbi:MAG TPA: ABC transporter permease [Actinomycetales bacterium]|nr:ABC transporter permease [Actinomycetales bacterium]
MSAITSTDTSPAPAGRSEGKRASRTSLRFIALAVLGLIVLLSVVRQVSGATDLTAAGAISAALALAVPIAMAGLGGLWSERAGVVNIGLEGMMILGTWGAGWAGYQWGPWAGLVAAIIFGAIGGLLHAIATVIFTVDHIVSGVAINILALGATQYLSKALFEGKPGGSTKQSPPVHDMGRFSVPGIGDPLGSLERHHWFLVSDVAGILRGLLTNLSWITILAILLFPLTYWVLWRTAFGLRLRSCGESPVAAESLGINVYRTKIVAVVVSGGLAGIGGAALALAASNFYQEGQTGGRGYIGLAAMIFGNWRPGLLAAGSGLFGFSDALQLRGGGSVHALLLLVAIVVVLVGLWQLYRRRVAQGIIAVASGVIVLVYYLVSDEVPAELTGAVPYVTTLLVLALASQRLRMPAADGLAYRRGQGS